MRTGKGASAPFAPSVRRSDFTTKLQLFSCPCSAQTRGWRRAPSPPGSGRFSALRTVSPTLERRACASGIWTRIGHRARVGRAGEQTRRRAWAGRFSALRTVSPTLERRACARRMDAHRACASGERAHGRRARSYISRSTFNLPPRFSRLLPRTSRLLHTLFTTSARFCNQIATVLMPFSVV